MPEKIDVGGFFLKQSATDMSGQSAGDMSDGPPIYNDFSVHIDRRPASDSDPFPGEPQVGDVVYVPVDEDGNVVEQFFYWDGVEWTAIVLRNLFDGVVRVNFGTSSFETWDEASNDWIPITITAEMMNDLFPDWFTLSDAGDDSTVDITAATPGVGVLNLIFEDLPTSDPGGGKVWLSTS